MCGFEFCLMSSWNSAFQVQMHIIFRLRLAVQIRFLSSSELEVSTGQINAAVLHVFLLDQINSVRAPLK